MANETKITERIKYDTNAQHVLKNYTPRIGGATLAGTIGLAVVGVPALIFGGVAAGALAIAGVTGLGAGVTLANTYINRAVFRNQFKKVEGKGENLEELVNFINEYDKSAKLYRQILANHAGEKKVEVIDADGQPQLVSVRKVNKWVKENEEMVYEGLKYLYKKALTYTNKLNDYNSRKLSAKEEKDAQDLYDKLAVIGKLAVDVTIDRLEFNPYKKLIIDTLHKGCLIGVKKEFGNYVTNDRVNDLIKGVRGHKDIEEVKKVYTAVYEQPAIDKLAKEEELRNKIQKDINDEHQKYLDALNLLDKLKNKGAKLTREEQELKEKAEKIAYNFGLQAEVKNLITIAQDYRDKFNPIDQGKLDKALASAEKSLKTQDNSKMLIAKNNLEKLIKIAQTIAEKEAFKSGRASLAEEINGYKTQIEGYKTELELNKDQIAKLEKQGSTNLKLLNNYNRIYNMLERNLSKTQSVSNAELLKRADIITMFYSQFDRTAFTAEENAKLDRISSALDKGEKLTNEQISQLSNDINVMHVKSYEILNGLIKKSAKLVLEESSRANVATNRADEEAKRADLEAKRADNQTRRANNATRRASIEIEKANIAKAETEVATKRADEATKRADDNAKIIERKQGLLNTAAHAVGDLRRDKRELQQKLDKSEIEGNSAKAQNKELKTILGHLKEEYEQVVQRLDVAIEQSGEKQEVITKLEKQRTALRKKVKALDAKLTSRDDQITNRNKVISDLSEEVNALQLDKDNVDKLLKRVQEEAAAERVIHETKEAELEGKNAKLQKSLDSKTKSLAAKTRANAGMKNKLEAEKARSEELEKEVMRATHAENKTKQELEVEQSKFEETVRELLDARDELKDSKGKLDEIKDAISVIEEKKDQGSLEHRAKMLIDKITAHVNYTMKSQNYDRQAVVDMIAYIDRVNDQIYTNHDEDLQANYELTRKMYEGVYKARLAKISDAKLSELREFETATRKYGEKQVASYDAKKYEEYKRGKNSDGGHGV